MSDSCKCNKEKCDKDKKSSDPKFSDELPDLHGSLSITVRDAKTNEVKEELHFDNLVMTFTRWQISFLFSGNFLPLPIDPDTNERYITRLQIGTSGTAEDIADAAITNPVTITPLEVTYPSSSSVQFAGVVASDVGNGTVFREAGLLFGNPSQLATRRVFSSMTKSSLWIWEINWVLAFS